MVTGESGVGKSSLLRATVDYARGAGFTVAPATGAPLESEFAFGVVRQIFESLLPPTGHDERENLLRGTGHAARSVLGDHGFTGDHSIHVVFEIMHGLHQLVSNLATRTPLFLVVDDAHLADGPSMRFLAYLAKRLMSMPIVIALCTTEGEQRVDEVSLQDLATSAHHIDLDGLDLPAVELLLRTTTSIRTSAKLVAACHQVTGGNPFLLQLLLWELRRQDGTFPAEIAVGDVLALGSARLAERLHSRLRAYPDAERLAQAVAILGDNAPCSHVRAFTRLDRQAIAEAADTLVRFRIFRNTHPVAFAHSLVRNTVLTYMSVGTRIAGHDRAARLLHEAHAPDDQVAAQLLNGGMAVATWALDTLRRTARRATAHGAPDVAATYLRHAVSQPLPADVRAEVLFELGNAELAFDRVAGIARLRTALAETTDSRLAARVVLSLIPRLYDAESTRETVSMADQVSGRLGPEDLDLAWRLRCVAYICVFNDMATVAGARARFERLCADMPDNPQLRLARQTIMAGRQMLECGARDDVVRYAGEVFANPGLSMFERPHIYGLLALIHADELELVEQLCRDTDQRVRDSGYLRPAAIALMVRGLTTSITGNSAAAVEFLRSSLALFDEWDTAHHDPDAPHCVARLVEVLVIRGQFDEARQVLARRALLGALPTLFQYNFVLLSRGRLRIAAGDMSGGLGDLLECGRRLNAWGVTNPAMFPWRSEAAHACLRLGDLEQARQLASSELESARDWGTARSIGTALHALAMAGDVEPAHQLLTDTVEILEQSPSRYQLASALADLAALSRQRDEPAAAQAQLLRAAELARQYGARPLIERLDKELLAIGATHALSEARFRLTHKEKHVVDLALRGLTNKHIARELQVSLRTVEFHLTNSYRKLGIDRRDQLLTAFEPWV